MLAYRWTKFRMFRLFLPLMAAPLILALDLGTTAAKAALFDLGGRCVALFRRRLPLRFLPGRRVQQHPHPLIQAPRRPLSSAPAAPPAPVPPPRPRVARHRPPLPAPPTRTPPPP